MGRLSPTPRGIDSFRGKPPAGSPTGAAGGDLSGAYPNPVVAQVQGRPVSATAPGSNQGLVWTGTAWAPTAVANSFNGRTGTVVPTTGDYTAGQVGALAATAALGGDLTGNAPNPTIAAGAVTLAKTATGTTGLAAEAFSAYRSAALTMSTATGTLVAFDTKEFDVSSRVDIVTNKGRYTPQTPGYYLLSSVVFINEALTSAEFFEIVLRKNGAAIKEGSIAAGGAAVSAGSAGSQITAMVQANGTTDYFEIFASWQTLASTTIQTGAASNWFSGHLIGKS